MMSSMIKKELINEKVQWIKQNIAKINPESNTIQTESGESFGYDILVIATGVVYEFESIKGLIQEIVDVSAPNIATIYTPQSSLKAQKLVQKIAKEGGEVIFSEQKTQNKCGGANKKLNFLIEDLSHTQGTRYKFKVHLYTGCKAMLSSPLHAKMIEQMYVERDMPYSMLHQLIEVDVAKNTALFQRSYVIDGEVRESSTFERSFDYLFMVPKIYGA